MLTISILNYNSLHDTEMCVRDLTVACAGLAWRVLIRDHSHASETESLQEALRDVVTPIHYFSSPDNPGFARGHNLNFRAVDHAAGDLFLILNPDVRLPDPGVLESMLDHCSEARIASCVIETTAHGDVWFSGGSVGRLIGVPTVIREPFSGTFRHTDYVTGCCLMISASLFSQLGGFDENYFMYSEDVDLCLRASRIGAEAVVVNRRIVHRIGSGEKGRYSDLYLYEGTKNRLLCLRRHRLGFPSVGVLYLLFKYGFLRTMQLAVHSRHPLHQILLAWRGLWDGLCVRPGESATVRAIESSSQIEAAENDMARSLMILPFSPNPIRIRVLEILSQLMRSTQVDILCLDDGNPILLPRGVRRLRVVPNASKLARMIRLFLGVLRGYPMVLEFYNSLSLRRILAGVDLSQYDLLYVTQLPIHRLKLQHPHILFDAVDCWSYKCHMMAANLSGYQSLLYRLDSIRAPRHEAAACNTAHVVLAAAEREATHLLKLGVTCSVLPFMHGRPAAVPPRALRQRDRLVVSFHGKLSYKPNEIALSLLNNRIAPRLDPERYSFRILGQCPAAFPAKFPALTFTGYVDSMFAALSDSDLSIIPLTISVGFPNKALESLAVGVPFIATPGVIEGLPPMPELLEHGIYVREVDEFPAEIERFSRLSLNERQEISDKCRRSVDRACSQSARDAQWDGIMLELEQCAGAFTTATLDAQYSSLPASGIS